jgi:hypothetical protein
MDPDLQQATEIMAGFAERTGLTSAQAPRRYLWTDAFAVRNYLAMGSLSAGELALRLIDQVHTVLGHHRPDDSRQGWLSGLSEPEGALHPTQGGLRIGKELPERPVGAPFDERLEWERDGQYFHYLTQWMQALEQASHALQRPELHTWAHELAQTAHRAFVYGAAGRGRRMAWKMSVDLSRPLVPSMGHHDPLEGWLVCLELSRAGDGLEEATADFASLMEGRDWQTTDPLGLGGLLVSAWRVDRLELPGGGALLETLLEAALEGLAQYIQQGELRQPPSLRLGFRELGLALGLAALDRLGEQRGLTSGLTPYRSLRSAIVSFWRREEPRQVDTWREHLDINEVMLASCLLPTLAPPARAATSPAAP